MLFQTFPFLFVFLPVVLLAYWARPGRQHKQVVLLISSFIFYGYWDIRFCALLLGSSLVDFVVAPWIADATSPRTRKSWLLVSIAVNLSALGFFKYWDFFADSTNRLLDMLGIGTPAPLFHIILPVGISFYTFQSMSYTIDVYRGRAAVTRSLIKFLTFVSMFPQLVAGPIVRWTELSQQLDELPRRSNRRMVALGCNFFIVGLFKKLCIADAIFPLVDPLSYAQMGALEFWPAFAGWTFWLYYDFSSYGDMAVGLGLLLGLRLPMNFNSPLKAQSISDLWGRWHITLGSWMRDYVFFPIGGTRGSFGRTLANLMVLFLVIGLWHGANWTMVGWGIYNGVGICVQQIAQRLGIGFRSARINRFLVLMFWMNGGWFFRADSLDMTAGFFAAGAMSNGWGELHLATIAVVVACAVHCYGFPNSWEIRWRYNRREALVMALAAVACVSRMFVERPFFYFQF